jgi:hypothetical protein
MTVQSFLSQICVSGFRVSRNYVSGGPPVQFIITQALDFRHVKHDCAKLSFVNFVEFVFVSRVEYFSVVENVIKVCLM